MALINEIMHEKKTFPCISYLKVVYSICIKDTIDEIILIKIRS